MSNKLVTLIIILFASNWNIPDGLANNLELEKSFEPKRSPTQPYVPDEVKNRYKRPVSSNQIEYNGQLDPLAMPKHIVLEMFLSRVYNAQKDPDERKSLDIKYRQMGLSVKSQKNLVSLSKDLKQSATSKRQQEIPALCNLITTKGPTISASEIANFINHYRKQRDAIYGDVYQSLSVALSPKDIDIFKKYLTTVYARQLSYSMRKPITVKDIKKDRMVNMCKKKKLGKGM